MTQPVVALDGPAGSGKSTVAVAVGAALGFDVLDTGAMYRAATVAALRSGVDLSDGDAVAAVTNGVEITLGSRVMVDGDDVSEEIRGPRATAAVSTVAAVPAVRTGLVARQRAWLAGRSGGVVEGRDIGTVVFPDAAVKVYLTATVEIRARRRSDDEVAAERDVTGRDVRAEIDERDGLDSSRTVAPLAAADDAVVIDTSELAVDDVVGRIVDLARAAGLLS